MQVGVISSAALTSVRQNRFDLLQLENLNFGNGCTSTRGCCMEEIITNNAIYNNLIIKIFTTGSTR